MTKSKVVQGRLKELLEAHFGSDCVYFERSIRREARDAWGDLAAYAPVPDLAVGPLNLTEKYRKVDSKEIRCASRDPLIKEIEEQCKRQNCGFSENRNPRCLLAIEIEFSRSRKYILGDFVNAGMMGHVGVVIGSRDTIETIERIQKYVKILRLVDKVRPDFLANTACYTADQFKEVIRATPAR